MDQAEAIKAIEDACKNISIQLMKIGPALPHLANSEKQGELIKQAHIATTAVEVIKKQMIKLKGGDDSTLL